MANSDVSVAPKERVNIKYTSAVGDAQEDVELPLRILLLGEFTGRADERLIEERKPINLDKNNFKDVMRAQDLRAEASVPNRLTEDGGDLNVQLKFESLDDFRPEGIVQQVSELRELMALRDALKQLKGPLGNTPAFVKRIRTILKDPKKRSTLMQELGISEGEA